MLYCVQNCSKELIKAWIGMLKYMSFMSKEENLSLDSL
jgi:hypothetical protein